MPATQPGIYIIYLVDVDGLGLNLGSGGEKGARRERASTTLTIPFYVVVRFELTGARRHLILSPEVR